VSGKLNIVRERLKPGDLRLKMKGCPWSCRQQGPYSSHSHSMSFAGLEDIIDHGNKL